MQRAVLAGCGAMAEGWIKAIQGSVELSESVKIVGLVDLDLDRAKTVADGHGLAGAIIGSDLSDVIGQTDATVVFDVVVPAARFDVAGQALAAGCHVLSEKPMATSMDDARALIDTAARAGRLHSIVQNRRYIPGVRRLRRLVQDGTIGDLTSVHCDFFIGAHFGGFREDMDHVLLLDMAIHTFDAGRFILGGQPQNVYCVEQNPKGSWYRDGAAANAIFGFDEGRVLTYRGSWCAEGANTSWESSWRLVGTKGTALWDGHDMFSVGVVTGENGFLREIAQVDMPDAPDASKTSGHASVIADFLKAVETGQAPETISTDNIYSLAMVLGAIESAETGQRVDINIKE
ncbi:Gfo/Idh/MocA family protein [Qingshengfaniella alkalisoli]|uniref:Gfo/Idh/MocA family oxidoreductase n=1 Tax=Qingshengfaniella alkalisoli TaxID=2599296 RepID=A0A5B8I9U6_9RHOB|nr:Gfo/Idh/MocA family oxidoreductase [Qingshengfaniella alkalisoli]QDY70759.1 Gfo/Idh/MocA family oxidoreductase [Qingshengfaniella alkalisoli]